MTTRRKDASEPATEPEPAIVPESEPVDAAADDGGADGSDGDGDEDLTLDDLLADPAIGEELRSRNAKAVKDEVAKELAKREAKAKKEAERARMDELDRLKAEKAEAEERHKGVEQELTRTKVDRDLNRALVARGVQLADPSALEFIHHAAWSEISDNGADVGEAVAKVLERHKYLLKSAKVEEVNPAEEPRPSTAPPESKATQTPGSKTATPPINVFNLSPREYAEHRKRHGIH